jgi:crossover junction endodeoxyribonuclease RusA
MIRLPWPPRELSPNARVDRRAVAGIRKTYRHACGWAATAAGFRAMPPAPLHIDLTFCPPDRRPRDLDNMLSSIKAGLDGITDVIRVDDSFWSLTIRKSEPVPGGAIIARIGPPVDAVAIPMKGTIT